MAESSSSAPMAGRVLHVRQAKADTYIGRPGPWGNPFPMRSESERDSVCDRFEVWAEAQPWFTDAAHYELAGQSLGCFCAPARCHGDSLLRYTQESPRLVFVFGSNLAGRHGKGAAAYAMQWGAVRGRGEGLSGMSYALPTKDAQLRSLPLSSIHDHWLRFVETAQANPHLAFQTTKVGCGLAGYVDDQVLALISADLPNNILLPGTWAAKLYVKQPARVIVAVAQDFKDTALVYQSCDRALEKLGSFIVVSSGDKGAVTNAEAYAADRHLETKRFPALWRKEGESANVMRYRRMAWYGTHLIAFTDGRCPHIRQMIDIAKSEGLSVWVITKN